MNIRFKETYYDDKEINMVKDALINETDYLACAKEKLSKLYNTQNIYLTANGSLALDVLLLGYDFPKGSQIILPSFTYPSAPNSILRRGLIPVFCDIDPETLVMDIDDAKRRMTNKTVCVIPTHYGGASCDMDRLKEAFIGIKIIEDAALSIGAKYRDKHLGTVGDAALISFHKTKNVSSEEGGAIILQDNDIREKLEMIYNNGTDRQAFLRGEIPFYSWKMPGMNAGMSNVNAAILSAQLDKLQQITSKQKKIYNAYINLLSPMAEKYGFKLPSIPAYNSNNAHVYYLVFHSEDQKNRVQKRLGINSIGAATHYVPLHQSGMGKRLGWRPEHLPHTYQISKCMLRLPMHARMEESDCEAIACQIRKCYEEN